VIGSAARRELRSPDGEVIDEKLADLPREGIQSIFEIVPHLALAPKKAKACEVDQPEGCGDLQVAY